VALEEAAGGDGLEEREGAGAGEAVSLEEAIGGDSVALGDDSGGEALPVGVLCDEGVSVFVALVLGGAGSVDGDEDTPPLATRLADREADRDRDDDTLTDGDDGPKRDGVVDAEGTPPDGATDREADRDRDGDTLTDGDDGAVTAHCTKRMYVVAAPHAPPVGAVSCEPGRMPHEFTPRQDVLATLPLAGSAPTQVPTAKGPDGQAPVGLP
jgi:hypothetical protein